MLGEKSVEFVLNDAQLFVNDAFNLPPFLSCSLSSLVLMCNSFYCRLAGSIFHAINNRQKERVKQLDRNIHELQELAFVLMLKPRSVMYLNGRK